MTLAELIAALTHLVVANPDKADAPIILLDEDIIELIQNPRFGGTYSYVRRILWDDNTEAWKQVLY